MSRAGRRKGRRGSSGTQAVISGSNDPQQLLPMALEAHQSGQLSRARALYEQVLAAAPEHTDALQFLGVLCHQEGDSTRAAELIRQAIAIRPDVAPYHDNLATVLESTGRTAEALEELLAAETLEGRDPERDFNLGVVLERLQRFEEAAERYRSALAARGDDVDCAFGLANACKALGQDHEARTLYEQVLEARPHHHDARVNLANLLQAEGELDAAEDALRRVLASAPQHPGAQHNLGSVLAQRGRLHDALDAFRSLSHSANASHELRTQAALAGASVLEQLGNIDEAVRIYRAHLADTVGANEARRGLLRALSVWQPQRVDDELLELMRSALANGEVAAAAIARAGYGAIADRYLGSDAEDDASVIETAVGLGDDALMQALSAAAINVDPRLERWLTKARALLLARPDLRAACAPLLAPLARLAALSEHVFTVTDDEKERLAGLEQELGSALATGRAAQLAHELALFASYAPLERLGHDEVLLEQIAPHASPDLRSLIENEVSLRARLSARAARVEQLRPISDPTSSAVRAQYEDNPYPRWSELPLAEPRRALGGVPMIALPRRTSTLLAGRAEVLVAGCGTGQEALAIAVALPNARITALDLSLASLAYAAEMADRLDVNNVRFVHGDLLDVSELDRRFDIVTASGVLHHLAEPERGLDALLGVLAPRGMMKIALYSHAARGEIRAARERIEALGLASDAHGVRTFRARVLDGEEPGLSTLLASEDFYSTSSCRDLLFHAMEHQFELPQIERLLASRGLAFLGFELAHRAIAQRFRARFADRERDLDAWHEFEQAEPQAFAAMYTFWVTHDDSDA